MKQIVKRILKPASRILSISRRATRMYEPLPNAFLPLLFWTPVVGKTFDEIAHRLAAGKPRLQVEQCDYDTTKGKDEYLHRQPKDLDQRLERRLFDLGGHVHVFAVKPYGRQSAEAEINARFLFLNVSRWLRRGTVILLHVVRLCRNVDEQRNGARNHERDEKNDANR